MFLTTTNYNCKIGFESRKMNYSNRKWIYFSYSLTSNPKTSFTKHFLFLPGISKTGNGITQISNEMIYPTTSTQIRNCQNPNLTTTQHNSTLPQHLVRFDTIITLNPPTDHPPLLIGEAPTTSRNTGYP